MTKVDGDDDDDDFVRVRLFFGEKAQGQKFGCAVASLCVARSNPSFFRLCVERKHKSRSPND